MGRRYLAYGSNLCAAQMATRCPAARAGDLVELGGWRFAINRRGVGTLLEEPGARAAGLLWDLTEACEAALDIQEGVAGGHYRKARIEVAGGPALVYLATEARPGAPREGYLERILAAAEARGVAAPLRAGIATWARPVQPWLVEAVLERYRLDLDGIHGPSHWLRVRANGLTLKARTPGADAEIIELFALLHDCRRRDDGRDRGHGERAAAYATKLARDGLLRLDATRLDCLVAACSGHDNSGVSSDPTIGCCWDADRLELSRLGRRPIERLLSTQAARDATIQALAWERGVELWHDAEGAAEWDLAEGLAVGASRRCA